MDVPFSYAFPFVEKHGSSIRHSKMTAKLWYLCINPSAVIPEVANIVIPEVANIVIPEVSDRESINQVVRSKKQP